MFNLDSFDQGLGNGQAATGFGSAEELLKAME